MISRAAFADSVMDPTRSALADVYAKALLQAAGEGDAAKAVGGELRRLAEIVRSVEGADDLLADNSLSDRQREALARRLFSGRVGETIEAVLVVMARRGRLGLLFDVAARMDSVANEEAGRREATVVSAVELDEDQRRQIERVLSEMLGIQVVLRTRVDPDVLGGLVLRIGDDVYDASLASDLGRLRTALLKPEDREEKE